MRPWFGLLAILTACSDYDLRGEDDPNGNPDGDTDEGDEAIADSECGDVAFDPEEIGVTDECTFDVGGFEPIVEWEAGAGKSSLALPIVADIDRDGLPEVIANIASGLGLGTGDLYVFHGDGTPMWNRTAKMGYGSSPAVGDLDGDGSPEIVIVKEYANSMMATGDYTAVAYDAQGTILWESAHFVGLDFDYATAVNIADMDGDGIPEVICGRVILNADGTTRGVGKHGRGSYGITEMFGMTISEASVPAVVDLDLDGQKEVVTGNAMYDADGNDVWFDPGQDDGMIGIANLDDDEAGEIVACTHNTVRGIDTDGRVMWGPVTIPSANILSPPGIEDLDGDGSPEIVVAGGNWLFTLHADGTTAWTASVHDESGATGASFFDFEGDGRPEVVYIDEVEMIAYDGMTGAVKFHSTEHASATMMDYPTIADVDADGHAEIIVAHQGYSAALSVYEDATNSWAPARLVWNQHAYDISNVNDDLSIPAAGDPGFSTFNSWHSNNDRGPEALIDDLEAELLDICEEDCDTGFVLVAGRLRNRSTRDLPAGVPVTLYARVDGELVALDTEPTAEITPSGWTGETMHFAADASIVASAARLVLKVDDNGTGGGIFPECSETNNQVAEDGPFCR
jgi:hypothetical protein